MIPKVYIYFCAEAPAAKQYIAQSENPRDFMYLTFHAETSRKAKAKLLVMLEYSATPMLELKGFNLKDRLKAVDDETNHDEIIARIEAMNAAGPDDKKGEVKTAGELAPETEAELAAAMAEDEPPLPIDDMNLAADDSIEDAEVVENGQWPIEPPSEFPVPTEEEDQPSVQSVPVKMPRRQRNDDDLI